MRIPELRRFIAQASEVTPDLVAEAIGPKRQPHRNLRVAVGKTEWEARSGERSRGGEANEIPAIHRSKSTPLRDAAQTIFACRTRFFPAGNPRRKAFSRPWGACICSCFRYGFFLRRRTSLWFPGCAKPRLADAYFPDRFPFAT